MHIWLKTYVIRTKSNVSKVVRRWAAAARYYSYQCTNPACQCEFMLDQAGSDDPQEPVACPVCQGKIAKAVKR
jgi:predicted nucleic acid-binding Zn ribbon protein